MANQPNKKKNLVAFVFEDPQWVPVIFDSSKTWDQTIWLFFKKKKKASTAFF